MADLACVYELRSINLANLPEIEQARVLDQFATFLNSLTDPVSFEVVKDVRKVDALGASYPVPYMRFFVGSGSQIDDLLAGLVGPGKFVRVPSVPTIDVSHVSGRYVVDKERQFVQTFNITRLGGSMEPAFLTRVYGLAHSVKLQLLPIEPHQARVLSRQRAKALQSGLILRQMDGRLFNPEREAELQRVQAAAQSIAAGNERLFKAKVSIRLREKSYSDLVAARKRLRQALGGVVDEMDSPRYLQEPLLTDKGPEWARGQWFFLTTAAATAFFPFAGLDIVDPTGVFVGQSLQTGGAILYDLYDRENYNLAVMGMSVAHDESLIYRDNGIIRMGAIGDVVDRYYGGSGREGPVHISSVEVVSFDPTTMKASWTPVQYVFRHRYSGSLLRLTLQTGRKIHVTPDHSVFSLRQGSIQHVPATEIRPGDFVVGPRVVPDVSLEGAVISLPELLLTDSAEARTAGKYSDFYIKDVSRDAFQGIRGAESNLQNWKKRRMLPLRYWSILTPNQRRAVLVGSRHRYLPSVVQVDEDLAWFLGVYAAEGHLAKLNESYKTVSYTINFSLGPSDEQEVIPRLQALVAQKFGVKAWITKDPRSRGVQFRFGHKVVYFLLRKIIGTGAHGKVVPEAIFNSPSAVRRAFLAGWMKGDVGVSVSAKMIGGISYLLLMEECVGSISQKKASERGSTVFGRFGVRAIRGGPSLAISFPVPKGFSGSDFRTLRRHNEPRYPISQLPNPLRSLLLGSMTTKRVTPLILDELDTKVSMLSSYAWNEPKHMAEMRTDGLYRRHVGRFFDQKDGILKPRGALAKLEDEMTWLNLVAHSDLSFFEVQSVEKVNNTHEYVYDVSVPSRENFLTGFGGIYAHNTGYGKSTAIKAFFSRLAVSNPEMMVYVFDSIVRREYSLSPDGTEEHSFAGIISAKIHRYKFDEGAGLDPFAVFRRGELPNSPPDTRKAASLLASMARVDEDPDLLADLYIASETCDSVDELILKSPERLKKRLGATLKPYMFLFKGEMKIYPRMVFVLNDIPNSEIRDAAAFLTLAAVWQAIKSQPVARKKAIVIDEGWSLVETNPRTGKPYFPLAVEYVPEIARTGRHYNCSFTICSQLVADFFGRGTQVGPGRAMVESCATKVVLRQDQAASSSLKEAFNLSDVEERFIISAKIGQGLLLTQEGHMPFQVFLSDLEQKLFTTRPSEVTA